MKWSPPKAPSGSKAPGGAKRAARTRDYFRVEDKAGLRFWLFRAGLYRDMAAAPRWFLHGMFA